MIEFKCPHCQRRYKLSDKIAGRKAKCSCGTSFVVPSLPEAKGDALRCTNCQSPVEPHWKACPECGEALYPAQSPPPSPVPPDSGPTTEATVRSGDNSVIKANISQPSSVAISGDATAGHPPSSSQASVHTGEGSVVKAEIDASQMVSVAGDLVDRKELHSHYNVYKESGVRVLGDMFTGSARRPRKSQECVEQLTHEISSGIGVLPFVVLFLFWPVGIYLIVTSGKRKTAKVNVLFARLRDCLSDNPEHQTDYERLEVDWDHKRVSLKRHSVVVSCVVIGIFAVQIIMPLAMLPLLDGMLEEDKANSASVNREVIQLMRDGEFDAARIKARELPYVERRDTIEDIQRAETRWETQNSSPSSEPEDP